MQTIKNPWFGQDNALRLDNIPHPSVSAERPIELLKRCPDAASTSLRDLGAFATAGQVFVKDERSRMGLGSFKALGAAYVIAQAAQKNNLTGITYVAASAGNHGLSVAAGAKVFGAQAVIYLADTVPESFAAKLQNVGASVVRAGADYAASMQAAQAAAADKGWILLSDSSWPGYVDIPQQLMEGYLVMAAEIVAQIPQPPTHIILQAGVGGLAAAAAAYFRVHWGSAPSIIVVEPDAAPALFNSIKAGHCVTTAGAVSNMGRLDCKEPSLIALKGLARDADIFCLISDAVATAAMPILDAAGLATTPSGGAGLAALLAGVEGIDSHSRVLCILTEERDN